MTESSDRGLTRLISKLWSMNALLTERWTSSKLTGSGRHSFVVVGMKASVAYQLMPMTSFQFPEANCSSLPRGPMEAYNIGMSDTVVFFIVRVKHKCATASLWLLPVWDYYKTYKYICRHSYMALLEHIFLFIFDKYVEMEYLGHKSINV